jgi:hypothetical protein
VEGTSGAVERGRFREWLQETALQGELRFSECGKPGELILPNNPARDWKGPSPQGHRSRFSFQSVNGVSKRQEVSESIGLG